MKYFKFIFGLLFSLFFIIEAIYAKNPIITTMYTADPSAHVWGGRVWLYPSHDQDDAKNYASMDGHHVFSSSDLINWIDHGEIMHTDSLPWANSGYLWAPDASYKNGVYYYYYPAQLASDGTRNIGVATSCSPAGPFVDHGPIEGANGIDPCVFIDDDNQAYLFFGSNTLKWAKLNDDMMTLGEIDTVESSQIPYFKEGAWVHKRDSIYYLSYAHTGVRKPLLYCTSNSIAGPWTYRGVLMDTEKYGGWTNQHSIVKFNDQWYIFYHNTQLSVSQLGDTVRQTNFRRSVCVDSLFYNDDGTIKKVIQTDGWGTPNTKTNLSLMGVTSQSSTLYNYDASLAIDGNIDGDFNNGSVTYTDIENHSWWQVDLGEDYPIGEINIFGRTDSCMAQNYNYTLYVFNENGDTIFNQNFTNYPFASANLSGIDGRVVKIELNQDMGALMLAEVEVYLFQKDDSSTSIKTKLFTSSNERLKVYPNPVNRYLNINFDNDNIKQYKIYNKLGNVVLRGSCAKKSIKIDISTFKQGIYLIKVGKKTKIIYKNR